MKLMIFSVMDAAVNAYLQPLYARTKAEALRMFTDAVNAPDSSFKKHAGDYRLAFLGEWDDNTAEFFPVKPEFILSAKECFVDDIFTPDKRIP